MGASCKTNAKTEQRIAALLTASTTAEAAALCQVSESTVYRWLQEPAFAEAYQQARRQVLNTAIDKVQQLTEKAAAALERNLNCGMPSVEVRAALGVLEMALKVREFSELNERVQELERAYEQLQTARRTAY